MSLKPYFVQKCPACSRMLSVDVESLGHGIVCRHCGDHFVAHDGPRESAASDAGFNYWASYETEESQQFHSQSSTLPRRAK